MCQERKVFPKECQRVSRHLASLPPEPTKLRSRPKRRFAGIVADVAIHGSWACSVLTEDCGPAGTESSPEDLASGSAASPGASERQCCNQSLVVLAGGIEIG